MFFEARHLTDSNFDDHFYQEVNNLYNQIINEALNYIIIKILRYVRRNKNSNIFKIYITYNTNYEGVIIPARFKNPKEEMTLFITNIKIFATRNVKPKEKLSCMTETEKCMETLQKQCTETISDLIFNLEKQCVINDINKEKDSV